MNSEQRLEGESVTLREKSILGRGNSQCKGSEAEV